MEPNSPLLFLRNANSIQGRQRTKVSARGSFPRVGVEDGNRRLACRQTACAFDPEATTFSPTMATYWPAKRERSACMKNSNSLLEAFLRRRLAIHFFPLESTLTGHSWFVNLNPEEHRVIQEGLVDTSQEECETG
jgi:nucleotidyltransferase/DNA polymerase involved in DNA repair